MHLCAMIAKLFVVLQSAREHFLAMTHYTVRQYEDHEWRPVTMQAKYVSLSRLVLNSQNACLDVRTRVPAGIAGNHVALCKSHCYCH